MTVIFAWAFTARVKARILILPILARRVNYVIQIASRLSLLFISSHFLAFVKHSSERQKNRNRKVNRCVQIYNMNTCYTGTWLSYCMCIILPRAFKILTFPIFCPPLGTMLSRRLEVIFSAVRPTQGNMLAYGSADASTGLPLACSIRKDSTSGWQSRIS